MVLGEANKVNPTRVADECITLAKQKDRYACYAFTEVRCGTTAACFDKQTKELICKRRYCILDPHRREYERLAIRGFPPEEYRKKMIEQERKRRKRFNDLFKKTPDLFMSIPEKKPLSKESEDILSKVYRPEALKYATHPKCKKMLEDTKNYTCKVKRKSIHTYVGTCYQYSISCMSKHKHGMSPVELCAELTSTICHNAPRPKPISGSSQMSVSQQPQEVSSPQSIQSTQTYNIKSALPLVLGGLVVGLLLANR